jgi:hypothetical protein
LRLIELKTQGRDIEMIRNYAMAAITLLGVLMLAGQASAAAYGNFMDPSGTVFYNNVADVNGLYGAPSVSLNSLDFTPTTFEAQCASCLDGFAQTDDTLTMDIVSIGGQQITEIGIAEGLDYQIQAFGTGAFASVTVAANIFVDIFEVNGASVNGISDSFSVAFSPSNSYSTFGPTGIDGDLFEGLLNIDIQQILLDNATIGEATGVRLSFDNTLQAFHSGGGQALIRKRDADFVSLTINGGSPVPEPGTAILLMGGLAVLASRRRS